MIQSIIKAARRVRVVEVGSDDQRPKRRFVEYRLSHAGDDGSFVVVDVFDEFNPVVDEYERKREATRIGVPETDGEVFARVCTEVRRELDRSGLKIFFDPPDKNGRIRPKWRYKLGGRLRTDFAEVVDAATAGRDPYDGDPDSVSSDIVEMVRSDREYYIRKEWKDWFGRKLQRKREDVVSQEAAILSGKCQVGR